MQKIRARIYLPPKTPIEWAEAQGAGSLTEGANHPSGVMTYFNLANGEDKKVTLSYLSMANDTIKKFSTRQRGPTTQAV